MCSNESVLALKDPNRPFPTGAPLGVLKWRLQVRAGKVQGSVQGRRVALPLTAPVSHCSALQASFPERPATCPTPTALPDAG